MSSDSSTCSRGRRTVGSGSGREFGEALSEGRLLDFLRQFGLLSQRPAGGILALTDEFTLELNPGTLLINSAHAESHIEERALLVDAVIKENIELCLGKRGATLFFTIFTFTWLPIVAPEPSLIASLRRMSMRTLA